MPPTQRLVLLATALVSFSGCGNVASNSGSSSGGNSAETNAQLDALGKAYHTFHLSNKKGPSGWDEAIAAGDSEAITALRDKGCLVAWGKRFKDATNGIANTVLAYPPSTMESGGPVLLLDGSVLQAKPEPLKKLLEDQAEFGVPE